MHRVVGLFVALRPNAKMHGCGQHAGMLAGAIIVDRARALARAQELARRVLADWPVRTAGKIALVETGLGEPDRILDIISTAQLLSSPAAAQGSVTDMVLPDGAGALATQRVIRSTESVIDRDTSSNASIPTAPVTPRPSPTSRGSWRGSSTRSPASTPMPGTPAIPTD